MNGSPSVVSVFAVLVSGLVVFMASIPTYGEVTFALQRTLFPDPSAVMGYGMLFPYMVLLSLPSFYAVQPLNAFARARWNRHRALISAIVSAIGWSAPTFLMLLGALVTPSFRDSDLNSRMALLALGIFSFEAACGALAGILAHVAVRMTRSGT